MIEKFSSLLGKFRFKKVNFKWYEGAYGASYALGSQDVTQ